MGLQREEVAKRITEIYNLPITWEEYLEQSYAECVRLMSDSPLLPGELFKFIIVLIFSFFFFPEKYRTFQTPNKYTKK